MRFLRREAEGGLTIAEWYGGFAGVCLNGHSRKKLEVSIERCPCCRGAFDIRIEIFGLELMAYNDGGPCEWETVLELSEDQAAASQI
jgi:hypothetical protein